jgi:hypothetical protein
LALALAAGLARPARAGNDELAQAQFHAQRAAAASNLGNYVEAAREYEAAYMKSFDVNMLVNVGQAWQQAGDRQKALAAFHSYVRVAPNGEHLGLCQAKIRELEGQPAGPPAVSPYAGPAAPPMMAAPPPPPPPMPVSMPAPPPPYAAPPAPVPNIAVCEARATATADTSPFYQHWPFWAVFGAAVVAGAVAGVLYVAQDTDLAMPVTTFGTKRY